MEKNNQSGDVYSDPTCAKMSFAVLVFGVHLYSVHGRYSLTVTVSTLLLLLPHHATFSEKTEEALGMFVVLF